MRPRLLDLFCGAGGAAKGYHQAGFDVVGVDINPQPNYPYTFFQSDALDFLGEAVDKFYPFNYCDAIHASPPCQAYTELNNNKTEHPRLIAPVRRLLEMTGIPYVIENVPGARLDMVNPVSLVGWQFGLGVKRERLFEANWDLISPSGNSRPERRKYLVYEHGKWRWTPNVPVYGSGGRKAVEYWPYAMGVGDTWDDCWMTRSELAEAIPPAYTEFVGKQLLAHIESRVAA